MREVEPNLWMALVLTHGGSRSRGHSAPFPSDLVSEVSLQSMLQQWWDAFRVMHGPALSILSRGESQSQGGEGPAHARLGSLWKRRRKLRVKANRHLRMALSSPAFDLDEDTSSRGSGANQTLGCIRAALQLQLPGKGEKASAQSSRSPSPGSQSQGDSPASGTATQHRAQQHLAQLGACL